MEVAETKDRLHLKTTYYSYGRHAEDMGDIPAAIKRYHSQLYYTISDVTEFYYSYEKSETHQFEVPRMLLETADLEDYVLKSHDKFVFCSSSG